MSKIELDCVSKRGYVYERRFFPATEAGEQKAKNAKAELLARHLNAEVHEYTD